MQDSMPLWFYLLPFAHGTPTCLELGACPWMLTASLDVGSNTHATRLHSFA